MVKNNNIILLSSRFCGSAAQAGLSEAVLLIWAGIGHGSATSYLLARGLAYDGSAGTARLCLFRLSFSRRPAGAYSYRRPGFELYSIGHSKSRGWPRFPGWRNKLHLLMGAAARSLAKDFCLLGSGLRLPCHG